MLDDIMLGNEPKGMRYLVSWLCGIIYAYIEGREMDFLSKFMGA